jgi:hypothetical protein
MLYSLKFSFVAISIVASSFFKFKGGGGVDEI